MTSSPALPPMVPVDVPAQPARRFSMGRLLAPSLSDFFFIALMLWMFSTGLGWQSLLQDGDTGWHIRTGEYILDHGAVPVTDLFSFSKTGAPWYAWEWLSDVLYAVLHRSLGLRGIVFLSGALICATAIVVLKHMLWRGAAALVALPLTLLLVGACSVHYHARPHLFTMLFLALSAWLIDRDARLQTRAVWLLVPMTALWTNLHGGFLVLIACLGLAALGSLLARNWSGAVRYAMLGASCGLASVVNPYGIQLHIHIAAYLQSDWIRNTIQEFQSPVFRSESMLQFEMFLLVGLAASGFLLVRRQYREALWIGYFAHASLASSRHVPLYVILATPLIASEVTLWWRRWTAGRDRKSTLRILDEFSADLGMKLGWTSLWCLLAIAILFVGDSSKWPTDFPDRFPRKIAEKNAERLVASRLLTTDQWADYLIYRFYPRQRVFVDGRSDFYGESLGKEYLAMMQADHNWKSLMEKHRFDAVLAPLDWPLTTVLKMTPGWRIHADDGKAILFLRGD